MSGFTLDKQTPQLAFRKAGFVGVTKTFKVEATKNVSLQVDLVKKQDKVIGPAGRPDTGLERPF